MGENPDAQDEQAEEEEEENEEEDDAGGEDAADANNGAQGNGCGLSPPFHHDHESIPTPQGRAAVFKTSWVWSSVSNLILLILADLYLWAFISMTFFLAMKQGMFCVLRFFTQDLL